MIRRSFIFLPRIGKRKELAIKEQGIKDWDDFLEKEVKGISKRTKQYYNREIIKAKQALYNGNSAYFTNKLPSTQTWRLYDFFKNETVFLDIETSGTSMKSYVTLIGLYDGLDTKIMIRDINLNVKALKYELSKFKLIVTFNGASFDIPMLNKKYPGLLPKIPHFDLRHACHKIGLKGGLKYIEQQLGIKRNKMIEKLYGGDALLLWRMFRSTGDKYYLNLLVEYNEEDIINLKRIADYVVDKLSKVT